jgi:hypothetical protein
MNRFEPEKLTNDHKILRFLNADGLLRTLGIQKEIARQITDLYPTFLLHSRVG